MVSSARRSWILVAATVAMFSGCGEIGRQEEVATCGDHPLVGVWSNTQTLQYSEVYDAVTLLAGGKAFRDSMWANDPVRDDGKQELRAVRFVGTWSGSEKMVTIDWSQFVTTDNGIAWTAGKPLPRKISFVLEDSLRYLKATIDGSARPAYQRSIACGSDAPPKDVRLVGHATIDSAATLKTEYRFDFDGKVVRSFVTLGELSRTESVGEWSTQSGILTIKWISSRVIRPTKTEDLPLPAPVVGPYSLDTASGNFNINGWSGYHYNTVGIVSSGGDDD